ncbi:amino acid adenylation domain-containing protein [Deefgea tanakiae]|uniref:Amino acid adenylation domain-containing protein n=1 Tax=Deefgea tanakiae TaxID=2865840 RepID=A0ABX8Z819_9NEIS|nr:non-ribosomal peptide synthetase [Deefgea tanakiae]QZA78742.1 amino acid adenylation domain-containing protein [Deefgea tanakiae]
MTANSARLPATSAQFGIWMGQQMAPLSPCYLTAEAIELTGVLDLAALSATVRDVLNHSATLHIRFEMNDEGLWLWPQTPSAQLEYIDFRGEADPDAAAQQWIKQSLSVLCDPTKDTLYRSAVLQTADDQQRWYLQVHHIAIDGFGYGLICQAVAARYSAIVQNQTLPVLPDWSLDKVLQAEKTYQENGKLAQDKAFWIAHMQQAPGAATIDAAQELSDDVLRHSTRLSRNELGVLQRAAQLAGQDWGSWMLAAISGWLVKQSGQRQLTFGLPVMNRLGTPAINIPCMAMNIVPMSVNVDPANTMQALSAQLAGSVRMIRPHLYYRYGWIRADLGLLEIGKHLFNQAVNIMPFDRHAPFAGLTSVIHPITAGPVKDLNISVSVLNAEWRVCMEANPNAYSLARLAELHSDLMAWLAALASTPPTEPLSKLLRNLPPLSQMTGAAVERPVSPVITQLIAMGEQFGDKNAIEFVPDNGLASDALTYAQLLARVQQLATRLVTNGLQANDKVVILMPRSPDAIIAILATLWAGGCYVPLDPLGPTMRLERVLLDANAQQIMTLKCWADKAGGVAHLVLLDQNDENQATSLIPAYTTPAVSDPAYLLYTSGSTGAPNGVLLGHGALSQFVASSAQLYQIKSSDRVLQFAPLHFDASIEEIFLALCNGATLVLRTDAMLDSGAAFSQFIAAKRISVLDLPTAYWHELAHALTDEQAQLFSSVRLTIIGGEAALPERARRWQNLFAEQTLLNSYGPTEASIIATTAALSGPNCVWDGSDSVPIGAPRPGVTAQIVDEHLYPVPLGQAGELLLCGEALALHYHGQPELTARRFVTLSKQVPELRAYRTGDRACLQDGQLRFLGRLDNEIKISGLRIDPSEIENALLSNTALSEVAVVAVPRHHCGYALAAFVVCAEQANSDNRLSSAQLRAFLTELLPAPAIPNHWHFLANLPRNVNGKIDRKHLAGLVSQREVGELPDASPLEQQIMQVWFDVLGEMPVGVQANFFDLGGKSLQAIQVSSQLSRALQREVAASALFNHATVQALAKALSAPVAHRPPVPMDGQTNLEQNAAFAPLLTIQQGTLPALFCLHPAEGLSWCYLSLAKHLPDVTIYGLQADHQRLASSFDAQVESYVERIVRQQPQGPYRMLGWSLGGALAHEIAARLQARGEHVELVAMMDSYPAAAFVDWREPTLHDALITVLSVNGEIASDALSVDDIYQRLMRPSSPFSALGRGALERLGQGVWHSMKLFRESQTATFAGDVLLFRAGRDNKDTPVPATWLPYLSGKIECVELDCNHFGMSDPAPMRVIGQALAARLAL